MDDKMSNKPNPKEKGFVEYKLYGFLLENIKEARESVDRRMKDGINEVITEDEAHHIKYHLGQAMAIIRCNLNAYEKRKR